MSAITRFGRPLVGVLLALVGAEAVARGLHSASYVHEEGRGYVMAKGVARSSDEAFGTSTWQEGGVRRTKPWSKETPRVLVLGDSFTEALMLDDDVVFTDRLERALHEKGVGVEILNLGRSTDSVADYVALAPLYKKRFDPSWVVVEARTHDFTDDAWAPGKTRFVLDGDGVGVEKVVPAARGGASGAIWRLRQASKAVNWAATRASEFAAAARQEPPLFRAGSVAATKPDAKPKDAPVEEELELLVKAYDGRVTLLYVPAFDPTAPDAPDPIERRVLDRCRAIGASCVTIRDRYPDLVQRGVAPFGFATSWYNTGHANAIAHALFADALVAELAPKATALLERRAETR